MPDAAHTTRTLTRVRTIMKNPRKHTLDAFARDENGQKVWPPYAGRARRWSIVGVLHKVRGVCAVDDVMDALDRASMALTGQKAAQAEKTEGHAAVLPIIDRALADLKGAVQ